MTLYRTLIELQAKACDLDPNLVEAVVIAESNGCTDAFRYEPAYYETYIKGKAQYAGLIPRRIASSYGLMQVMYPTAQQYGFGDLPELLFLPDVGIKFGCLHLAKMLSWANGDVRKALAAYNGGMGAYNRYEPQRYASRVAKLYDTVKLAYPAKDATA